MNESTQSSFIFISTVNSAQKDKVICEHIQHQTSIDPGSFSNQDKKSHIYKMVLLVNNILLYYPF